MPTVGIEPTWQADYGFSPAEIVGSNPTGGMDICLLWVLCVTLAACLDYLINIQIIKINMRTTLTLSFIRKSSIHDSRFVQKGYRSRPTSILSTGHRECLIWTPSIICGVRWKGQCRKPGLSSLPETVMTYGPLCQTRGMKLLRLSVTFDHWLSPWHEISTQSGRSLLTGNNYAPPPPPPHPANKPSKDYKLIHPSRPRSQPLYQDMGKPNHIFIDSES
jgi:hypothetical protein